MQGLKLPIIIKAKLEAWLLRVAAYIVGGRNVHRAMVVSRTDNNAMFEMAHDLRAIANRIEQGYRA